MSNENPEFKPLDGKGLTLVWELAKAAFMSAQTASAVMQSLQSQIDSVASKDSFDELKASVLTADIIAAQKAYAQNFIGDLQGTATTAGNYTAGGGIATALGTKFDKAGGELRGNITLDADNTRSIGTSSKRLKDLYAVAIYGGTLTTDGSITVGGSLSCAGTITMKSVTGSVVDDRWRIASRPRGGAVTDDSYAMRVSYIGDTDPLAVIHVTRDGRVGIGNAIADAIKTGYKLNVDGNMRTAGNMDVQGGVTGYGGVAAHGISDLTTMF